VQKREWATVQLDLDQGLSRGTSAPVEEQHRAESKDMAAAIREARLCEEGGHNGAAPRR